MKQRESETEKAGRLFEDDGLNLSTQESDGDNHAHELYLEECPYSSTDLHGFPFEQSLCLVTRQAL